MQDPVLILGATGSLGGAIARDLARSVPLAVHGRTWDSRLETLTAETGAQPVVADLADPDQVAALFNTIPKLSGLVFAAGCPFPHKLAHRTGWEVFQQQIDSQLKALHLSLAAALPKLRGRDGGARVVVLSTEFVLGNPPAKIAPYMAAKAAMTAYARVVAQEWLAFGVRVHVLAPGMVPSALTTDMPQEYLDQVAQGMPEKRLTDADDVAGIARFLLTAAADPLYGTIIPASRAARR
jgi:NAD(P)-dependent dehydrogenase (short-subunit alcohol dehydrogenase family)